MERERIVIQDLKRQYDLRKEEDVLKVADLIVQKGYRFETREGMDFDDEIYERAKQIRERRKSQAGGSKARPVDIRNFDTDMQHAIRKQMKVRDVRRMVVLSLCFIVAFACIGFFVLYYYKADQSSQSNLDLAGKVKDTAKGQKSQTIKEEIYVDEHTGEEKTVILQVLEKYEELYSDLNIKLEDYTDELCKKHKLYGKGLSINYLEDLYNKIVNKDVTQGE